MSATTDLLLPVPGSADETLKAIQDTSSYIRALATSFVEQGYAADDSMSLTDFVISRLLTKLPSTVEGVLPFLNDAVGDVTDFMERRAANDEQPPANDEQQPANGEQQPANDEQQPAAAFLPQPDAAGTGTAGPSNEGAEEEDDDDDGGIPFEASIAAILACRSFDGSSFRHFEPVRPYRSKSRALRRQANCIGDSHPEYFVTPATWLHYQSLHYIYTLEPLNVLPGEIFNHYNLFTVNFNTMKFWPLDRFDLIANKDYLILMVDRRATPKHRDTVYESIALKEIWQKKDIYANSEAFNVYPLPQMPLPPPPEPAPAPNLPNTAGPSNPSSSNLPNTGSAPPQPSPPPANGIKRSHPDDTDDTQGDPGPSSQAKRLKIDRDVPTGTGSNPVERRPQSSTTKQPKDSSKTKGKRRAHDAVSAEDNDEKVPTKGKGKKRLHDDDVKDDDAPRPKARKRARAEPEDSVKDGPSRPAAKQSKATTRTKTKTTKSATSVVQEDDNRGVRRSSRLKAAKK